MLLALLQHMKQKVVVNVDKTNSFEVVDGNKDISENAFATYDHNYTRFDHGWRGWRDKSSVLHIDAALNSCCS